MDCLELRTIPQLGQTFVATEMIYKGTTILIEEPCFQYESDDAPEVDGTHFCFKSISWIADNVEKCFFCLRELL